jgi:hypothetical protein
MGTRAGIGRPLLHAQKVMTQVRKSDHGDCVDLTRISHQPSATARDKAVSTPLRSIAVLDILSKYADTR